MKKLTIAAIAATIALAVPVSAQQVPPGCWGDRPAMIAELTGEKYQERQITAGVSSKYKRNGIVGAEFWVNPETGTYTYVFEYNHGGYCVGDEGNGISFGPFEEISEPEGDPA